MRPIYEQIRWALAMQPMPLILAPVVGELFQTAFGYFRVESVRFSLPQTGGEEYENSSTNEFGGCKDLAAAFRTGMFTSATDETIEKAIKRGELVAIASGKLIDFKLADRSSAEAHVSLLSLQKKMRKCFCHDCIKICYTPWHFGGLECMFCQGFNTVPDGGDDNLELDGQIPLPPILQRVAPRRIMHRDDESEGQGETDIEELGARSGLAEIETEQN